MLKYFQALFSLLHKLVFITAKIAFIFTSLSVVYILFSYIHSNLFFTSRVYLEPT